MAKTKKSKVVARPSRFQRYIHSFHFPGVIAGMVFVYLGFLPSLLPRGWVLQGVLSGVLFSIGYGLGLFVSHLIRKFKPTELAPAKKHEVKIYTYLALALLYVVAMIMGNIWQEEVNNLVGQKPDSSFSVLGSTLIAVLFAALLILIARLLRSLYGWLKQLINKYIPKAIAYTLAWVITLVVFIGLLNGIIISNTMELINDAFGTKNGTTDSGIVQPNSPELSGSSQSYVPWDTLGRQGRKFVGLAKTPEQLTKFSKTAAVQPVRIYSGLESADNAHARAKLAVDDLKRAGGFNKKVLVVVTTTGTGWVDENGVDPVEYMYNGDSAMVAMQYSYLPSWLSFLVDKSKAKEAGVELYNAVHAEWLKMPEDQRPKLVSFGESLGSFGSEAAFPTTAAFKSSSQGAVWVGPPHSNSIWQEVTQGRDAGSPEILPVVNNGQTVRFVAVADDLTKPKGEWQQPRAVYLQHASDPITWWSPKLLFQKPDWLKETRGSDVSSKTMWIPIVTFFQVSGDMVFSTGVPNYHGHNYGTLPTAAWGYVAPPAGWTQEKTDALRAELSK